MRELFVGIPCYNEEDNIESLVDKWMAEESKLAELGFNLLIVPLDDKSTDSTYEILKDMEKNNPKVKAIYHEENKNLGGGLRTLVDNFLEKASSGDVLTIMDGDNTQDPKYIGDLLSELDRGRDLVVASRYRKGSKVMGVPKHRILMSYLARFYYSLVLSVKDIRDYTCGYRVYSYDGLKRAGDLFGEDLITQTSFACMMELLYKVYISGGEMGEVPFVLRYDHKLGESEIKIVSTSKDSILTALRIRKEAKNILREGR